MKNKSTKGGDAAGVERGTKGYAWCDTDAEFLQPSYDRRRQQGKELAVGMFATSRKPRVVNPKGDLS